MHPIHYFDTADEIGTRKNNSKRGSGSLEGDRFASLVDGKVLWYSEKFDDYSEGYIRRAERQGYTNDLSYYKWNNNVPDVDYSYSQSHRSMYWGACQTSSGTRNYWENAERETSEDVERNDMERPCMNSVYGQKRILPHPNSSREKSGVKRQRTQSPEKSNSWTIPLSNIIMAKFDSVTGVPELVFSRFYNCKQEAYWENCRYLKLRVNREKVLNPEKVSIPIPNDSISGVAVFCGMNRFDKLLEAYDDRINLKSSIENLTGVIKKCEESYSKKLKELHSIPEIVDTTEEVIEVVVNEKVTSAIILKDHWTESNVLGSVEKENLSTTVENKSRIENDFSKIKEGKDKKQAMAQIKLEED